MNVSITTQPSKGHPSKGHVEVRNFGLSYPTLDGPVEAVCDASIHVNPGEFVSIVGPSGCGKSTLLNAVAGFLKPTEGDVTLDGEAIDGPSADRGMVFQQYSLFPWKTVKGNVEFGLKMKHVDKSSRDRAARTLLGLAGLTAFENKYPDSLSGGMKQRVGIVRALATGPKVLLLDEPFGALDAQTRVIMQQILTNMWQRLKISVLFVTHDIDEAIFLSDRVYCMTARPGTIKAEIAPGASTPTVDDDVLGVSGAAPRTDVADPGGKHQGDGRRAQRPRARRPQHRHARGIAGFDSLNIASSIPAGAGGQTRRDETARFSAWHCIASRSLSSGAYSRDPLVRNDVERTVETSPRHCEELLRRSNPVFLRCHWIASLRSQ
jgi:NitT/TauT family transport system ATP-binding protein